MPGRLHGFQKDHPQVQAADERIRNIVRYRRTLERKHKLYRATKYILHLCRGKPFEQRAIICVWNEVFLLKRLMLVYSPVPILISVTRQKSPNLVKVLGLDTLVYVATGLEQTYYVCA